MDRVATASAIAMTLAVGAGLTAQSPSATFKSAVNLVTLNVTVTEGEKLVTGLAKDAFEIYEDGVRQQVRFFESAAVPLDLVLLLDASSSMRGRMAVVHDAARDFMKVLRPQDRGAVVAFNEHVQVVQDLTGDGAAIETAIGTVEPNGSTALHNAIYVALKAFGRTAAASGEVRRQAIAVLSDGEDTSSLVSFDDVVTLARGIGVSVYTIGLQSERTRPARDRDSPSPSASSYMLKQLARETGARAFFPADVHALKDVYSDIAEELRAQYALAYRPSDGDAASRFRRIVVRLPANPELRPRTRTGYTVEALLPSAAQGGQVR